MRVLPKHALPLLIVASTAVLHLRALEVTTLSSHVADEIQEDGDSSADRAGSGDMWNEWGAFSEPVTESGCHTVKADADPAPLGDVVLQHAGLLTVNVRI